MQRYFVDIIDQTTKFLDDDIFHITRVMRSKIGDSIEIVDQNQQLYLATITDIKPLSVSLDTKLENNSELKNKIKLLYVMAKGEKTDFVIQKATELGVSEIVLLHSQRSVVKIEQSKIANKIERFHKIAKEAAEQSHRLVIPKISIEGAFDFIKKDDSSIKLIADEDDAGTTLKLYQTLDTMTISSSISLLVGSEGGFDRKEVALAVKSGFVTIGLGKRILRSETAAIHFVGVVASYLERK